MANILQRSKKQLDMKEKKCLELADMSGDREMRYARDERVREFKAVFSKLIDTYERQISALQERIARVEQERDSLKERLKQHLSNITQEQLER